MRSLDLARTNVTAQGIRALKPLTKLESLKLAETGVGDEVVEALGQLSALRAVTLDETKVTNAGLEKLSQRDGFQWMTTNQTVAAELARRLSAGDHEGVEGMLSIGVDLPTAGKFSTRSVVAHSETETDQDTARTRYRLEWDWQSEGKNEGLFAEVAVRQGTIRAMEVGMLETVVKEPEMPPATTVSIRGVAIDDETGKPVAPLIVQAGKFESDDPSKVTWGFSESRSSAKDGSFSTTVRWGDGWTARVIADGYLPQPVLDAAPPEGTETLEITLRMKRGRTVRGVVLDQDDQPVEGASVFAIGPTGLNLFGGEAWTSWGEKDAGPQAVHTDSEGRFEIASGLAERLAVSCDEIDAWPAEIAEEGDTTIKLPLAAHVEIEFDIEGADEEADIFFQLLTEKVPEFAGLRLEQTQKLTNGKTLSLPALPAGDYQFCRQVMNNLGQIGMGAMLDRQFVRLKGGEKQTIRFVRKEGARVRGEIIAPEGVSLMGTIVSIEGATKKQPGADVEWNPTYASVVAAEGRFETERVAPGVYVLKANAYKKLTLEQLQSSGIPQPSHRATMTIEVPTSGELTVPALKLEPIQ